MAVHQVGVCTRWEGLIILNELDYNDNDNQSSFEQAAGY